MYKEILKPTLDVVVATLLLIITSPVLLLAIIMLALANKGRVWFKQPRPGLNEEIFTLIKFKTMTDLVDCNSELLPDDQRLTSVGKFIRKTSLDELPQLINVIKGDMSIVGPRPLLVEYLQFYDMKQRKRHTVKPGITGWAQVNGRNTVSWTRKFEYDNWYVEHLSFWLDIKILYLTVVKVFKAEGINSGTSVTMERFRGKD